MTVQTCNSLLWHFWSGDSPVAGSSERQILSDKSLITLSSLSHNMMICLCVDLCVRRWADDRLGCWRFWMCTRLRRPHQWAYMQNSRWKLLWMVVVEAVCKIRSWGWPCWSSRSLQEVIAVSHFSSDCSNDLFYKNTSLLNLLSLSNCLKPHFTS